MSQKILPSLLLAGFMAFFTAGCVQKAADVSQNKVVNLYTQATLIAAVKAGDIALVSKNLKAKINPNTKDVSGESLLHICVNTNDDKMLSLLLDNKADINILNDEGQTPLHLAVTKNAQSMIELLLNKGAATEIVNEEGFAAIHTATKNNKPVIMDMILKQHPDDMKLKTKEGLTPLLVAISSGHFKLIKYYLKRKADLNAKTNDGLTALQLAMRSNSLQTLDFLLKKGAKIDQVTAEGKTLLHLASESGSLKIVRFLIKKGSKVGIMDKKRLLAIDYAVKNGHASVVAYLVKKQGKLSNAYKFKLLQEAVTSKNTKTLLALHKGGVDLSTLQAKTKSSILHFAVTLDGMEDVIILILKKTDLITHQDAKKLTALDYATKTKRDSYVEIMKPFYLKVQIRQFIAKDDFLGLKALKKQYPEIMELITNKKYLLALSGPDDLMIGDLRLLTKKGRAQEIIIAQIKRLTLGYKNYTSKEIGILISYGLPAPVIAAVIEKTDALAKDKQKAKENKATKVIQEALLKVSELALQAQSKVAKFQAINTELMQKLLEKQDELIQEQIATREALKTNKSSVSNALGNEIGKKIVEDLLN